MAASLPWKCPTRSWWGMVPIHGHHPTLLGLFWAAAKIGHPFYRPGIERTRWYLGESPPNCLVSCCAFRRTYCFLLQHPPTVKKAFPWLAKTSSTKDDYLFSETMKWEDTSPLECPVHHGTTHVPLHIIHVPDRSRTSTSWLPSSQGLHIYIRPSQEVIFLFWLSHLGALSSLLLATLSCSCHCSKFPYE